MRRVIVKFTGILLLLAIVTASTGCGASKETEVKNIWIMGDSLAADRGTGDIKIYRNVAVGWGCMLDEYLKTDTVIRNVAASGASSLNYLDNMVYQMALDNMEEGDYVLIQFGHNDSYWEDRATDPYGSSEDEGSFKNILKYKYIEPIIEKGAHPILITSVVGSYYDAFGNLYMMHYYAHAQAMRELVEECKREKMDVDLIDAYAITEEYYNEIGEEKAKEYHTDDTHYNGYGAIYAAGIIAEKMQELGVPCCKDIRTEEEVLKMFEN